MPTIKITDDNGKTTTCMLIGYSIEPLEEGIHLEINSPNNCIKYLIHSDIRERNIHNIESFISNQFDNALKNNKTVCIGEYLRRDYIYIGDGESRRQFTAQKK